MLAREDKHALETGSDGRAETIPETVDGIDAALAWHDGDARATIETLLADCQHLREQLALASGAISRGMTRGWMPSLDRE